MSDMDFDFGFGKEKDTPRIWETGTEKKENRRILDADRDVMLHGLSTDEDKKENEETKKALIIEESNVDMVENGSGTTCTGFIWNSIMIMYRILMKTAKYCKGTMKDKFLFAPLILLMLGKVIAPEETFLQTSVVGSVEVGQDFILNCTCRGVCTGNKRWTGGPNNVELVYNQRVLKDNINIIKNSNEEYCIKVSKATKTDIESNYTCHIGLASKQINRSELVPSQPPPTQSPTVTSTPQQPTSTPQQPTSTLQQPKKSNTGKLSDGEIGGIVVGVFVVVVAVIIVFVRKYNKDRRADKNRRGDDDEL